MLDINKAPCLTISCPQSGPAFALLLLKTIIGGSSFRGNVLPQISNTRLVTGEPALSIHIYL